MKTVSKLAVGFVLLMALSMVAAACPWCSGNFGTQEATAGGNGGNRMAGLPISICGPSAPQGETWTYQWLVWYWDPTANGGAGNYVSRSANVVPNTNGRCISETPTISNCGYEFGATLTITNQVSNTLSCISYRCAWFNIVCPACPTMTPFCEGDADAGDMPQGMTSGFTYTYTLDGSSWTPSVNALNQLTPGTHNIVATITPGGKVCPPISLVVGNKPSGALIIT